MAAAPAAGGERRAARGVAPSTSGAIEIEGRRHALETAMVNADEAYRHVEAAIAMPVRALPAGTIAIRGGDVSVGGP